MTDTRPVALVVDLPDGLADLAEELRDSDPAFLAVTLRYGLMRLQQMRYLADLHAERTLGDAVRRHVREAQRA